MANIEMVIDSIRVSLTNDQKVVILKEKEGVPRLFSSLLWDHEVGGSNPLTPTIIKPFPFCRSPTGF